MDMLFRPGDWARTPEFLAAAQQIMDWTRARFQIPEAAPVLVSQVDCTIPECSPLETVIAFWTGTGERHHFKIHKPVEAVLSSDLPSGWMDDDRFVLDEAACACC